MNGGRPSNALILLPVFKGIFPFTGKGEIDTFKNII